MSQEEEADGHGPAWTFFTSHARVYFAIAGDPDVLVRELAERVGLTDRNVQRIVADLEEGGFLTRIRDGRRTRYYPRPTVPLPAPAAAGKTAADLLGVVMRRREVLALSRRLQELDEQKSD